MSCSTFQSCICTQFVRHPGTNQSAWHVDRESSKDTAWGQQLRGLAFPERGLRALGAAAGCSPECEEGPHVQHRQQLRLRLGEREPVAQRFEGGDDHCLLGVGEVELDDGLPGKRGQGGGWHPKVQEDSPSQPLGLQLGKLRPGEAEQLARCSSGAPSRLRPGSCPLGFVCHCSSVVATLEGRWSGEGPRA